MRLTDAGIAGLKPDKTEFTVWDGRVAGSAFACVHRDIAASSGTGMPTTRRSG